MQLLSNTTAITKNVKTPFTATGGVEPYIYEVVSGGIGGTIDDETGLYTAPSNAYGIDTIKATDDDGTEVTKQIRVLHPLLLLCDIIQSELELNSDFVWLFDQKINKPITDEMFVVVREIGNKVFGNNFYFDDSSNQIQWVNMQSMIQIDVMSKSLDALYRKEEIVMSLLSQYSEQQQEVNSFKLGFIPTGFTNLSELDGNSIPYRYSITIQMLYSMQKTKSAQTYIQFENVEIISDNGQSANTVIDPGYLLLEDSELIDI